MLIIFILLLCLFFVFINITDIYLISDYFTGKGIDESFIYIIRYGIEGAGFKPDSYIIFIGLLLFILSILIPILVYNYISNNNNNNKIFIAFIFLLIAFIVHPFTKNILEYNNYILKGNNYFKNKNIIFIYLESFEKLYLDEGLFPGLSNGLNKLKKESIYFNNIKQVYGTSWTIAGMVGSQCGIPLITSGGGGNSMHGITSFLPGAFCVGDFLNIAGYNLNYIGGSKLNFAGKGNFYKTHGFNSVEGEDELIINLKNKKYKHDWGLYDDTIFDLAYKKYKILSKKDKKFGLFMINCYYQPII